MSQTRPQPAAEQPTGAASALAACFQPGRLAVIGLLTLAGLRVLISFSPELWWSGDPRAQPGAITELGPAAAAIIDWLCVAVLGLAVWDAIRRGGRLRWILMTLWAVGVGFALFQGTQGFESLRIGGHWIGALALALAAAHLGATAGLRRILLAGMIALLLPMGVQALHQVLIEHPRTVQNYEENTEQVLRRRGIEPGTAEQRRYERRLRQVEARGRFPLTNVFGTVTLGLTLLALGGAAGVFLRSNGPRLRRPGGFALAGLSLLGLVLLTLTFSKGAVLTFGLSAGGTAAACLIAWRWKLGTAWWWRAVALGVVAIPIAAVLIRGAIGPPETAEGERSLLFRYQYWQGAVSMLSEHPLRGVGPGGFQQAYLIHKPPKSPEEVADPHNVFLAYTATLGLGGLAWSALLVTLLCAAGRRDLASTETLPASDRSSEPDPDSEPEPDPPPAGQRWGLTLAAGGLIFITAYLRELAYLGWPALVVAGLGGLLLFVARRAQQEGRTLWTIGLVAAALLTPMYLLPPVGVWWAGAVGFIGLMGWLSGRPELNSQPARLGLFAAAVALLVHGQLEMSLTNTMAAPLLGALLGLAAADPSGAPVPRSRWPRWSAAALTPLVLAAMLVWHTPWIVRHQATQADAARALRRAGQNPVHTARARSAAIDLLPPADRYPPDAERALHAARLLMEQAVDHHRARRSDQRDEALERAIQRLQRARQTGLLLARLWRLELDLCRRAASMTDDPAWHRRAFRAAGELLPHDPYGIRSHRLAADAAWEAERFEQAQRWYRRTLKLNEFAYLDPMKQLSDPQRRRIRRRLQGEAAVEADPP